MAGIAFLLVAVLCIVLLFTIMPPADPTNPTDTTGGDSEMESTGSTTQSETSSQPIDPATLNLDLSKDVHFFGRTYVEDGIHYFNWSASGFSVRFKGSGVMAVLYSNDVAINHKAYIKIYIDGVEQKDVMLTKTEQMVTLAEGLDPNVEHTVHVLKRTASDSSRAGVGQIRLKDGQILPPEEDKELLFEFIGDSLMVGYAAAYDATKQSGWSTTTEDVTGTYCKQIADAFDADFNVIGTSGKGIVRNNGGDTYALMPEIYKHLDFFNQKGVLYDFQRQADVIVINLGTNDESAANKNLSPDIFKTGLRQFLKDVRAKNPNAYIVYAYGLTRSALMDEIEDVINELRGSGDNRICLVKLQECSATERHLNHSKRAAYVSRGEAIIDKIEEITGWKATN